MRERNFPLSLAYFFSYFSAVQGAIIAHPGPETKDPPELSSRRVVHEIGDRLNL
jgi:hypothetical protein